MIECLCIFVYTYIILMGAPADAPRYLVHLTDLDIYETDFKRRNIHVHDSKWYVFSSLSYIAYCFLHIVHCLLPVAFCLLPLASCPLCFAYRIANVFFLYCFSLTVLPLLPVLPIAYCLMLIAYCKQSPIYTHLYTYTRKTIFIYTHIPTGHIRATENTQYNEITFYRVWAPPDYNICTLAHTHANN